MLKIENIKIEKIKEFENNTKEHPEWQVEMIAKSIKEFGFNDPIALNKDFQIIEGHGRYLACKILGFKEIPCIILKNLTEAQERAYIIAHNKLTLNTGFDLDKLKFELNFLEVEGIDLTLTGFTDVELERITGEDEKVEADTVDYSESSDYKIVIKCDTEDEQEEICEKLKSLGIEFKKS